MKIEMDLPDEMVSLLEASNKDDEYKRNAFILYPYINNKIITIDDAARMLNVDYITICMLYFNYGFNLQIGDYGSITVFVKMKDDKYIPEVDAAMSRLAKIKKIRKGVYHSDYDVFVPTYDALEALMKRKWFRGTVELLVWKVEDEVEDLLEHFNNEIANGDLEVID